MRRPLKSLVIRTTAALVAAVVMYLLISLPPASRTLPAAPTTVVSGGYHVHTNRSDGSGTLDDVALAAAGSGLQFVIITDHGDGTRPPVAPHYRHGVLVIDAVEISTDSGHLVALGLEHASPYPLGGEARDAIEDIHRMGGWAVVAHPDSPKTGLRWRGRRQDVDGIEWLNADSEWRDESPSTLIATAVRYFLRPAEAIASVFERPSASLARWDQRNGTRHVVGLAAVDAHARIGLDETAEPRQSRTLFARPSYRDMFDTVVQAVDLTAPLNGDPAHDAVAIMQALRYGRTFSIVSAQAHPGQVVFRATDGTLTAVMGESLPSDKPVQIEASVPAPDDATVVLVRNGEEVAAQVGNVEYQHSGPAASYRVEVRLPGHNVPWLVTNAIRAGEMVPVLDTRRREMPLPAQATVRRLTDASAWLTEKHPRSTAEVTAGNGGAALTFQLAPGPSAGQYAAMAYPLGGHDSFDRVTLRLSASSEMRVSIQVRLPGGIDGERWQRSVYVSPTARTVTLRLEDFEPTDPSITRRPVVTRIDSLLIVVDTRHTPPGATGSVNVSRVSLGAPRMN